MWNSHFCFNWRLTRCDRTSFSGIWPTLSTFEGCGTRKDSFWEDRNSFRRSIRLRRIADKSSNSLWCTLLSWAYVSPSFFSIIDHILCFFLTFSSLIRLYLHFPLSDFHLSFLYSSRSFLISSYTLFSPSVGILETPCSAPFLLGITVKTFDV